MLVGCFAFVCFSASQMCAQLSSAQAIDLPFKSILFLCHEKKSLVAFNVCFRSLSICTAPPSRFWNIWIICVDLRIYPAALVHLLLRLTPVVHIRSVQSNLQRAGVSAGFHSNQVDLDVTSAWLE